LNGLNFILNLAIILGVFNHGYGTSLDTLILSGTEKKINLTSKVYYLNSPRNIEVNEITQALRSGKNLKKLEKINLGYTDELYWIIIPIKKITNETRYLLEIKNPHIDLISFYCLCENSITNINITGDYRTFNSRSYYHRNYVWPIDLCTTDSFIVILKIDKIDSSLNIPIHLWEKKTHKVQSDKEFFLIAIAMGIMTIVALYALIVGIYLKQKIYFIYLTLVISVALLLFTKEGLSFQFIYPDLPRFNGFFRVSIALITNLCLIIFSVLFLKIRIYTPFIYRVLSVIAYIYLVILLSSPFLWNFYFSIKLIMIPFILALSIAVNMLCVTSAILSYTKQPRISGFYLLAYIALVISGITAVLIDFGWLGYLSFNPIILGSLTEIMVFSFGLSYMMKKIYDERNELSIKIIRQQRESLNNYLLGIEKERERIAGELHDDIGSRLGNLRRIAGLQKEIDSHEVGRQIEALAKDVNSLSYQLNSTGYPEKRLVHSISTLVSQIKARHQLKFNLNVYDAPMNIDENTSQQIYRIVQEALHNILKHAQATKVDIQLHSHDNELLLIIEDDGKGFSIEHDVQGIGLKQMKKRADLINGKLEINSTAKKGTQIMLKIPLQTIKASHIHSFVL
jgi:signal transduction histidine kinase